MAPGQGRGVHVAAALRCSPQPRPRAGPLLGCGAVRTRLWPKVRRKSGGGADRCPPGQHAGEGVREACTCSGPRGLGFGPRKSLRTFDCPTWRRSRAGPRVAVLTGKSAAAFLPGSHGPGKAAALVSGAALPRAPGRPGALDAELVFRWLSVARAEAGPRPAATARWARSLALGRAVIPWHLPPLCLWLPRHRVNCVIC